MKAEHYCCSAIISLYSCKVTKTPLNKTYVVCMTVLRLASTPQGFKFNNSSKDWWNILVIVQDSFLKLFDFSWATQRGRFVVRYPPSHNIAPTHISHNKLRLKNLQFANCESNNYLPIKLKYLLTGHLNGEGRIFGVPSNWVHLY